jgi:hypothetical protein
MNDIYFSQFWQYIDKIISNFKQYTTKKHILVKAVSNEPN